MEKIVIDRHPGGQGRLDITRGEGDLLDVGRARHAHRHEHLVQQVAGAYDEEGSALGKQ